MHQPCSQDDRAVALESESNRGQSNVDGGDACSAERDVRRSRRQEATTITSSIASTRSFALPPITIAPSGWMARPDTDAGRVGRSLNARPSPLNEVSGSPAEVSRRTNGWGLPSDARSVPPPTTTRPLLSMATALAPSPANCRPTTG